MVFDSDRIKAMGDNFVPLTADQAIAPDSQGQQAMPQTQETPVAPPQEAAPTVEEPTPAPTQEPTPVQETPAETVQEKTPEEEADEVIRQILGEAEEAEQEVKEQQEKVTEQAKATGNEELKKELEEYKLKVEDMSVKYSAVTEAYKNLLDQKTNLETMNEEFTRKMQLISDNPLLQDLMRGMYLQGKDASAVTTVEGTLKELLKQYANIDVDSLISQARGGGAQNLASSSGSAIVGANQTYKGLFGEGDIVPLS